MLEGKVRSLVLSRRVAVNVLVVSIKVRSGYALVLLSLSLYITSNVFNKGPESQTYYF